LGSSKRIATLPWKILSSGLSQNSTTSCSAVKPRSMNCRKLLRIASRPCQSATPRLQIASSAKQSKPLPKVLSSISFHIASSHSGGAVFVKVMVFIAMLAAELAGEARRVGDDNADMLILLECHPNPLPPNSGTAARFRREDRVTAVVGT